MCYAAAATDVCYVNSQQSQSKLFSIHVRDSQISGKELYKPYFNRVTG
jgi:hypothetical protein